MFKPSYIQTHLIINIHTVSNEGKMTKNFIQPVFIVYLFILEIASDYFTYS